MSRAIQISENKKKSLTQEKLFTSWHRKENQPIEDCGSKLFKKIYLNMD